MIFTLLFFSLFCFGLALVCLTLIVISHQHLWREQQRLNRIQQQINNAPQAAQETLTNKYSGILIKRQRGRPRKQAMEGGEPYATNYKRTRRKATLAVS